MERDPAYPVRYGLMGHVGRFPLDQGSGPEGVLERGQAVVVLTDRGVELGEVLVPPEHSSPPRQPAGEWREGEAPANLTNTIYGDLIDDNDVPRLLRLAAAADLDAARRCETLRDERFTLCQRILEDGGWAIELIDVEPLLDQKTTVLHVLGAPDVNFATLRAEFRSRSDFDVLFELPGFSSGLGQSSERAALTQEAVRRCGDCDCSDGGCGATGSARKEAVATVATAEHDSPASCGVSSGHSGCASCGVSKWKAGRQQSSAAIRH